MKYFPFLLRVSSSATKSQPQSQQAAARLPPRSNQTLAVMPPPWVFLHRCVNFIDGEFTGGAGKVAAAILGSRGAASLEELTAALKPNPVVADPPEVTSLSMVRHLPKDLMGGIKSGSVSSTDKGLVVLYTGMYRPGNGGGTRSGFYLVYDASSSSLSAIPQLESLIRVPSLPSIECLGASAAILRCRYGVYILAELVTSVDSGLPNAHLYLWRSSIPTGQTPTGQWASLPSARQWLPARQWVPTEVCVSLPTELCGPTCFFNIDMAFAFEGSVCWVDLLTGVLICDLFASGGPKFSFILLPQGCCSYTPKEVRLATQTEEFRSMGVVCGAIKFVDLVGYSEGLPKAEVALKIWTLSSDFKEWKEGPGVLVRDLWESESFRENELPPRGWPMNPVLCMNEDEIIYISLCDIEFVAKHDFLGQCTGEQTVLNGHYVLRLDLLQNKVLYSKKSATSSLSLLRPIVLASDFSAYLHDGSKIHQRGEEASKVGTMVKRIKY